MKFQCHSCSAKYSISDEKITKGQFRVRCKKCDQMLTVTATGTAEKPALRGQRNENSLLFSARDLPGVSRAPTRSDASPATGNATRNEGSGLLDIRGLAATYSNHSGGEAAPNQKLSADSDDGSGPIPGLVTNDLYTPPGIVMPVPAAAPEPRNRLIWALGGIAGALAVVAIMLAVIIVKNDGQANSYADSPTRDQTSSLADTESTGGDENPVDTQEPTSEPAAEQSSGDENGNSGDSQDSETPQAETESSPTAVAAVTETTRRRRDRQRRDRRDRDRDSRTRTEASDSSESDTSDSSSEEEPAAECMDEVACVLADFAPACCKRYQDSNRKNRGDEVTTRSNLPDRPSRDAIKSGIAKVRDRVRACGQRHPASGTVMVSMKVGGNGRVERASIKETPDASLGRCVAVAMRSARFAESKSGASFKYPFTF